MQLSLLKPNSSQLAASEQRVGKPMSVLLESEGPLPQAPHTPRASCTGLTLRHNRAPGYERAHQPDYFLNSDSLTGQLCFKPCILPTEHTHYIQMSMGDVKHCSYVMIMELNTFLNYRHCEAHSITINITLKTMKTFFKNCFPVLNQKEIKKEIKILTNRTWETF